MRRSLPAACAAALKAGAFGVILLVGHGASAEPAGVAEATTASISGDLTFLEIRKRTVAGLEVRLESSPGHAAAMIGSLAVEGGVARFTPVLPFVAGQPYQVNVRCADGSIEVVKVTATDPHGSPPTVRLMPRGAVFPANALKFYLHFSEPMEQGVFLERLKLADAEGREVIGPFRETELWSPDGRRLTVWFHPGRQKTGVNLHEDEGPVLKAGRRYTLSVSGAWRSARGTALGNEARFSFAVCEADHDCPDPRRWQVKPPEAGTRAALKVMLGESVDPALLAEAISIHSKNQGPVAGRVQAVSDASSLTFVPVLPWQPGTYELGVRPELEDLAGNNLIKPFEVDLSAALPVRPALPAAVGFMIDPAP